MNIELSKKEVKCLKEYLELDLESIGFEEEECEILEGILNKLEQKSDGKRLDN